MKCIPPTLRWLELFRYVQPERGSITGSGMKNNKIKYTILLPIGNTNIYISKTSLY